MKTKITLVFGRNGFALVANMQPILTVMSLEPTSPVDNFKRARYEAKALLDGSSKFANAQEKFNKL